MKPSTASWMRAPTFEDFQTAAIAAGFDEATARVWAPDTSVETHTHPFDAEAVIVEGEMWLVGTESSRHLVPGDTFALLRGTAHSERYGAAGATYWVARRA